MEEWIDPGASVEVRSIPALGKPSNLRPPRFRWLVGVASSLILLLVIGGLGWLTRGEQSQDFNDLFTEPVSFLSGK